MIDASAQLLCGHLGAKKEGLIKHASADFSSCNTGQVMVDSVADECDHPQRNSFFIDSAVGGA
eukprot:7644251-Karenia_brevis.AAC.1